MLFIVGCKIIAMRNLNLDKKLPIDEFIGEKKKDKIGVYRIINGIKVYQLEEKDQKDIEMNIILNRLRAGGIYID